jgi:antitoxin HigA-1
VKLLLDENLSRRIVPFTRVHEIAKGNRSITPDTALRLARYFGGDAKSWLNLQTEYDLKMALQGSRIEAEVKPREVA